MNRFFIVAPLSFEMLALTELQNKCNDFKNFKNVEVIKGGIEFDADLEQGLSLNYLLKIPTRILLRLKSIKCRDYPKLYNQLKKIDWKKYSKSESFEFEASSHKSRLHNTNAMVETAQEAIFDFFAANHIAQKEQESAKFKQKIYLRLYEDELTISLDTTGNRLDKTTDEYKGLAPLRLNYASALVYILSQTSKAKTLIDPMAGSGSFLKSSLNFFELNHREFPFEDWFSKPNIKALEHKTFYTDLQGFDISETHIDKVFIELKQRDLFKTKKQNIDCDVICNPPYGKRVKTSYDHQEILEKIIEVYAPSQLGYLIPATIKLKMPSGYRQLKRLGFNNSGIKVNFWVFQRQ